MPIVALLPADPGALAVTGSDAAKTGTLHVTLLYLGEDPYQDDDVAMLGQLVADAVQQVGVASITADVSGVGTLGDAHAIVLTLESDTLSALQDVIAEGCEEGGFEDCGDHPGGWIAHLTVGYPPSSGPDASNPDQTPPAQPAGPVVDLFTQALAFQGTEIVFDRVAVIEGDKSLWEQSLNAPPPQEAPMGVTPGTVTTSVPGATYAPVAPAVKPAPGKAPPPAKAPLAKTPPPANPAAPAATPDDSASEPSGPNTLLVGMLLADPTAVTTQADTALPYMTADTPPYLALFELAIDATHSAEDVAMVLAPVDPGSTDTTVTTPVSATNPDRRAVLVDPGPFQKSYDAIRKALIDAGFTVADYPLAVQLGTVDQATAAGLKGTSLTFDGLVVVEFDGSVTPVHADTTSPDTTPPPAADPNAAPAVVAGGSPLSQSAAKITIDAAALDQAVAAIKSQMATTLSDPNAPVMDPLNGAKTAPFEGVLVVFGVDSGDGRVIEPGALTWRKLPVPLWLKTDQAGEGHDGAQLAGRINHIEDRGADLWATGLIDLGSPAGQELYRLMTPDENGQAWLRGVSVDLDTVGGELVEDPTWNDFYGGKLTVTRGRVLGATACVAPALEDASLTLLASALANLGLSGEGCDCEREQAMVAAAGAPMEGAQMRVWTAWDRHRKALVAAAGIPVNPPVAWFAKRQYAESTPPMISAEGQLSGHVASWRDCHIGFSDRCVTAPKSLSNYRYFANKQTLTSEGVMVSTGPIMMDTVHPDLRKLASDAQAFYAHTGCAFADVVLYEDEWGIAMAGAVRPDVTPEQLRAARGSDISPDWRSINGQYELVALLSVNASGFITPALAASAAEAGDRAVEPGKLAIAIDFETGELLSLVAAGMVRHESTEVDWQARFEAMCADFTELRQAVLPIVSENLSARQRAAAQRGGFRDVDARFEAMRARFVPEVKVAEVA